MRASDGWRGGGRITFDPAVCLEAVDVLICGCLKAHGIPTAVYCPKCLYEQPVFVALGYRWGDFPEAERASREVTRTCRCIRD